MKRILLLLFLITSTTLLAQVTITPSTFEVTDQITITVDTNSTNTDCNGFSNPTKVYMHAGVGPDANPWTDVVGNWGQDDGVGLMTNNGGGLWSITLTPKDYFGLTQAEADAVSKMGMVFRNESGSQEFKDNGCNDFFFNVGSFQLTLTAPTDDISYVTAGNTLGITATTSLSADFTLKANGSTIDTQTSKTSYSFTPTVNTTTAFVLEAESGGVTKSVTIQAIVIPTVTQQAIPSGIKEGINYHSGDATKVTLALRAPHKDYIYVAGSFNEYAVNNTYLMKQDTSDSELYWIEITGLTSGTPYTYQYWVFDESPITDSPKLVKTADPYSTLILSPYDDWEVDNTRFPNLPEYPTGQERGVTLIQTGQADYNWTVTNFNKPAKEDLVIYEVLIRDFDTNRTYQDLIDRIDYFKNLKINAIELMPVMEFEGNKGWGYNPSHHLALDKYYGTSSKLKEFIDLCHQNGIAVILDVVLNHATGRNPLARMWMKDADNGNYDGWGPPSTENPYFNTEAKHTYNVGYDFNHSSTYTRNYVKRFIEHWITEYKVDGFRWDLTKGFTQNCTATDEGCTGTYQQDRVDVLKEYADYSWSIDPTHYVIFEHLGTDAEEQQWANYRVNETPSKGIMMWGIMHHDYTQLMKGNGANLSRVTHTSRGFTKPRLIAYPESHDEERIMYEVINNGASGTRSLEAASKRMASLGAIYLTMPGPKMIWHFADLGWDLSMYTNESGTVVIGNNDYRLATKPQPQWVQNWMADTHRSKIYSDWSKLIDLKTKEAAFKKDFVLENNNSNIRLALYDLGLPSNQLKNVVILANFNTSSQNITPNFPHTGTWYNLIDNSSIDVTSTTAPISIPAGEFRIFGNQLPSTLSNDDAIITDSTIKLYPNPTSKSFQLNTEIKAVEVYNILGKKVAAYKGNFNANFSFDIGRLDTGIYIVKAKTSSGTIVKRLLKQ